MVLSTANTSKAIADEVIPTVGENEHESEEELLETESIGIQVSQPDPGSNESKSYWVQFFELKMNIIYYGDLETESTKLHESIQQLISELDRVKMDNETLRLRNNQLVEV